MKYNVSSLPPQETILVTSALPYANGPLHLGHLLETIQTDIWVRFRQLRGDDCIYVCADDAHGTAVMLKAQSMDLTPEMLIAQVKEEHQRDFSDFHISFDNFYSTHSEENRYFSELIYKRCLAANYIDRQNVVQAYDPKTKMFLADRFIRGTCPRCGAENQYGDHCEVCDAAYSPDELINPRSALSDAVPEKKASEHFFFQVSKCETFVREWLESGTVQPEVGNKLKEWLDAGLRDWDISRDAPYFGFAIPNAQDKYFYVWLDAPIGYMASFQNYCDTHGKNKNFADYWEEGATTKLYHFIGKDIINFHGLFWPALLKVSGFRSPTGLFVHGFVTVNGQKMSKSKGTFIEARHFLDHIPAECLRYYFASRLSSSVEDLDLNLADLRQRINADLVGKVINIASRCAGFIHKLNGGLLGQSCSDMELVERVAGAADFIEHCYLEREYATAIREIMIWAGDINRHINDQKPWELAREPGNEAKIQAICTTGLNVFRLLMLYLSPVLPVTGAKAAEFLGVPLVWEKPLRPLLNHPINKFKPLFTRIEEKQIDALLARNAESVDIK